ncbi:MAG TPA: hypothetical protein VD978_05030 [Azospirillum sp.]|nr:hypothetical protein [Azospirillum sp.]
MQIRHLAAVATFTVALLGPTGTFAADGSTATSEGFSAQLSDAKDALATHNSAAVGREERIEAGKYLSMAESLWDYGSTAKAQQFLNFARGKLGLSGQSADITLAEHVNERFTSIR